MKPKQLAFTPARKRPNSGLAAGGRITGEAIPACSSRLVRMRACAGVRAQVMPVAILAWQKARAGSRCGVGLVDPDGQMLAAPPRASALRGTESSALA